VTVNIFIRGQLETRERPEKDSLMELPCTSESLAVWTVNEGVLWRGPRPNAAGHGFEHHNGPPSRGRGTRFARQRSSSVCDVVVVVTDVNSPRGRFWRARAAIAKQRGNPLSADEPLRSVEVSWRFARSARLRAEGPRYALLIEHPQDSRISSFWIANESLRRRENGAWF